MVDQESLQVAQGLPFALLVVIGQLQFDKVKHEEQSGMQPILFTLCEINLTKY
jgi:hypothetical protein